MSVATNLPPAAMPGEPTAAAAPACEAFIVKIRYIWLMVLAPVAGFVLGLVNLADQPSLGVLLLAAALLALGYWAWRQAYQPVRLALQPEVLRIQPESPGQPTQDLPLARIANYLRPQESYYQILELQLHGSPSLHLSKRLRTPAAGLLTLDAWAEVLAARLEQTRPAAAPVGAYAGPVDAAATPASGLLATPPRVFARTALGKILAGLAGVWLVLAGLAMLGGAHVAGGFIVAPILYLGYFFRARGVLKVTTYARTGGTSRRPDALDREMDEQRERTFDSLNNLNNY